MFLLYLGLEQHVFTVVVRKEQDVDGNRLIPRYVNTLATCSLTYFSSPLAISPLFVSTFTSVSAVKLKTNPSVDLDAYTNPFLAFRLVEYILIFSFEALF